MLRRLSRCCLVLGLASACSDENAVSPSSDAGDATGADTGESCLDCNPAAPAGSDPEQCIETFAAWDGFASGGLCQPMQRPSACEAGLPLGLYDGPLADLDAPDELRDATLCLRTTPPATCSAGSWASPAAGACVSWPTCAAGDWPDEAVLRERALGASGPIVYVAPTGSDDGDGTRERPYGRIARGLRDAAADGIVALARGRYEENVTLGSSAWIVGACVTDTELVAPTADTRATVAFTAGARGGITALAVSGASPGVSCAAGASCHVRDVELREVSGYGAIVDGEAAELQLERVWVREPAPQRGGPGGIGVIAQLGGALIASDVLVDVVHDQALVVGDASAQLMDTALRTVRTPTGSSAATGLLVAGNGTLDASGLTIEGARGVGIAVDGEGASARVDRAAIVAADAQASTGRFGRGVGVQNGASLELQDSVVIGSAAGAVYASGAGTDVALADTHLVASEGQASDGALGYGVNAIDGAHVELDGGWIVGNRSTGVYASGEGTTVSLRGSWIASTRERASDDDLGMGVAAFGGATVTLSSTHLSHNRFVGVYAVDEGTTVELSEVAITHTRPRAVDGGWGLGLAAGFGARVVLNGVVLSDNSTSGMVLEGTGTSGQIDDVVVQRTGSSPLDGSLGRGINVQDGAEVVGARWLLRDNRSDSVFVAGASARIDVTDLTVSGTLAAACASTTDCAGGGTGVAVVDGGALEIERFSIVDSELIGVQVARQATMAARRGLLRGNVIGVNVQVPELELDTAFVEVRLEDNERDVASDDLPVPGPIGTLPAAQ